MSSPAARRLTRLSSLALLLVAATGSLVEARPRKDAATARAKQHFDLAETAYNAQRFAEALEEYERAYEAKPLPGLLFNIAQCHRQLEHWERAEHFYREYVDAAPSADNAPSVFPLIREMAERKRDAADHPAATATGKPAETSEPARTTGTVVDAAPGAPGTATSPAAAAPSTASTAPAAPGSEWKPDAPPLPGAATVIEAPREPAAAAAPPPPPPASPAAPSAVAAAATASTAPDLTLPVPAAAPTAGPGSEHAEALVETTPRSQATEEPARPPRTRWWIAGVVVGALVVAGGAVGLGLAASGGPSSPRGTLSPVDAR